MSLDSLFKQNNKNKNDHEFADDVSGEFRSRSEEESLAAAESSVRSKSTKAGKRSSNTGNSRKNNVDDNALPEKKRARRRLIGAVALVLAAVIGLPMIFDSEPNTSVPKIAIEIPSKEDPQTKPPVATPLMDASKTVNQGIDSSEEVIVAAAAPTSTAPVSVPAVKDAREIVSVNANAKSTSHVAEKLNERKTETVTASKPVVSISSLSGNTVAKETLKKPEIKLESKAEPKKEKIDDAARALALLEGRTLPDEQPKTEVKANKADNQNGSFVVQVAALNSAAKIKELQGKLKAANITSYTQKIITTNGEVSRIRVGPFASKAEAEKMRAKLVKLGLNGSLIPN
jgi:DedD protein